MSSDGADPSPPCEVRFEPRAGYLFAHTSGPQITPEAALYVWRRVAAECRAVGAARVLIENAFTGQLTVVQAYEVMRQIPELFHGIRIAFLDPRRLDFDRVKFAENVAVNRGVSGRVFENLAEAEAWLLAE